MHRFIFTTAVICLTICSTARADLIYQFSGGVTSSSDTSTVAIIETWVASYLIDSAAADTGPDGNGVFNYPNAILSASIEFSGGFSTQFDPASAPARIGVGDNIFGGGIDFVDAEIGDFTNTSSESLYTSVLDSAANSNIVGTALPGVGIEFTGFGGGMDLRYEDSGGAFQTVSFSGPMSFASVPDPGSFGLLGLFAVGVVSRRRKRNALAL